MGNKLETRAGAPGNETLVERSASGDDGKEKKTARREPAKSCVENLRIQSKIGESRISWRMAEFIEDEAPLTLLKLLVDSVDDLNIFVGDLSVDGECFHLLSSYTLCLLSVTGVIFRGENNNSALCIITARAVITGYLGMIGTFVFHV